MKKMILVAVVSTMMLVGCGGGEAPVATLNSPQPEILEETILEENILEENIITWDNAEIQSW